MTSNEMIQMYTVEKTVSIMLELRFLDIQLFLCVFLCTLNF